LQEIARSHVSQVALMQMRCSTSRGTNRAWTRAVAVNLSVANGGASCTSQVEGGQHEDRCR
jgi:hypothetical protein